MLNRPSADDPAVGVIDKSFAPHLFRPDFLSGNVLPGSREVIGDVVFDADGGYVGQIENLILDTRIGCVTHAVVGAGGFLGIGKRRYAIPWSVVIADAHAKRCALIIEHERLNGLPVLTP
jgi:hypothetical protein